MLNEQEEAQRIWKHLEPMIEAKIRAATSDMVRRKNFTVTAAPNGATVGVREAAGTTTLNIPYVSTLSTVAAGDVVCCEWRGNMTNLIAVSLGNGQQPAQT